MERQARERDRLHQGDNLSQSKVQAGVWHGLRMPRWPALMEHNREAGRWEERVR